MAADAKLAALFNLPGVSPPLRDEGSCSFFVDRIFEFYEHVVGNKSLHPWIDEAEVGALGSSLKTLKAPAPKKIDWMPDYGCAVLKSEAGLAPGEISLSLISLHLHRFQTTSKLSSDGYDYVDTAVSSDYEVLPIGTCALEDLEQIQGKFRGLLASSQNQSGRSGKLGDTS